jgi:hypothetical protein
MGVGVIATGEQEGHTDRWLWSCRAISQKPYDYHVEKSPTRHLQNSAARPMFLTPRVSRPCGVWSPTTLLSVR